MISYSLVVVWTGNIIGIAIATTKSVEDLEFCLPDSRTGMQLPDEAKSWQVQHVRNPNVLQRQAPFPLQRKEALLLTSRTLLHQDNKGYMVSSLI